MRVFAGNLTFLLIVGVAVMTGCTTVSATAPPASTGIPEAPSVPTLSARVSVSISSQRMFPGERAVLEVTVQNSGNTAFATPHPRTTGPSVLVVELRDPGTGEVRLSRSYRRNRGSRGVRLIQQKAEPLQPGQSKRFRIQLGRLMGSLPAGDHEVVVRMTTSAPKDPVDGASTKEWVTFSSEPLSIRVETFRPQALSVLDCPLQDSFAVLASAVTEDGDTVLIARETASGSPRDGSWVRIVRRGRGVTVSDVTLAAKAAVGINGRCFAWLEGSELHASGFWGVARTVKPLEPVEVGVETPRLVQPGFQLTQDLALFFVVGSHQDGWAVQPLILSSDGLQAGTPVRLGTREPGLLLASIAWSFEAGPGAIEVIWSEKGGNQTRVFTRAFNSSGEAIGRPDGSARRLLKMRGELVASDVLPLRNISDPTVLNRLSGASDDDSDLRMGESGIDLHLLFEVPNRKLAMESVALDLDGRRRIRFRKRFRAPPSVPDAWAVSRSLGVRLPVVATSRGRLFWARAADDAEWVEAEGVDASASGLHVLHGDGQKADCPLPCDYSGIARVGWFREALGLQYLGLPCHEAQGR